MEIWCGKVTRLRSLEREECRERYREEEEKQITMLSEEGIGGKVEEKVEEEG